MVQHEQHDGRAGLGLVEELSSAYERFRVNVVRVLREAGIDARSGSAIASELGLNRQLAWQIARIAGEPACDQGLSTFPGTKGLLLFAQACESFDGTTEDPSAIASLRESIDALEAAIVRHAGDRASLGLLTAAWGPKSLEARTEPLRRDGFRAQCALLGVQVDTQVRGLIFAPSQSGDPTKVSLATYQAFSNLVQLRRDRACRLLFVEAPTHDDGTPSMPLDQMSEHMRTKFELVPELSTGEPDQTEIVVQGARGWVTLRPGRLGRSGSTRWCFTGSASYEHPRYHNERDRFNQIAMVTHVPTRLFLCDVLMDRRLAEHIDLAGSLGVSCFDAGTGLPMRPVSRDDPAYLFDLETPQPFGPTEMLCDTQVPDLAKLVDIAAKRVGTSSDQLVGVRFQSSYVMSSTDFVVSRDLPKRD
jgi:hypothetical protein